MPSFTELAVDTCTDRAASVTFSAYDSCRNSVQTTATFTIVDTAPPVIVTPAQNVSVSPDDGLVLITQGRVVGLTNDNTQQLLQWLNSNGGAEMTDVVTEALTWTHTVPNFESVVKTEGTTCTDKFIQVVFTATDGCRHSTTTTAKFSVVDQSMPILVTNASSASAEMNSPTEQATLNTWLSRSGSAVAVDSGSTSLVRWSHSVVDFVPLDPAGMCTDTIAHVAFTAGDTCSNYVTTSANFTLVDTTNPKITGQAQNQIFPANDNHNVDNIADWLNRAANARAEDTVSDITWTHGAVEFAHSKGSACPDRQATVVFTAADKCGNTASTTATIVIVDEVAPTVVTRASNHTIQDDGNDNTAAIEAYLSTFGGLEVSKPSEITHATLDFTLHTCSGDVAEIIFTATDACGNTVQAPSVYLEVYNIMPPVIVTAAQDATIQADYTDNVADLQAWLESSGGAVAHSDHAEALTWTYTISDWIQATSDEGDTCMSKKYRQALFIVSDACGQTNTTTATFYVRDVEPPVIGCVAKFEMRCDYRCDNNIAFQEFLDFGGHMCVQDISGYTVTNDFAVADKSSFINDICGTSGEVTFAFTDGCGNMAQQTVEYVITEDTPTCKSCLGGLQARKMEFLWVPAPSAPTEVAITATQVGSQGAARELQWPNDPSKIRSGLIFAVNLAWVNGGRPEAIEIVVDGVSVVVDSTCNDMRLGDNFAVGDLGSIKLAGFVRHDYTTADECGRFDKCDPDLCIDTNVCVDGTSSIEYLTFMYVGYNPHPLTADAYSLPWTEVTIRAEPTDQNPPLMYLSSTQEEWLSAEDVEVLSAVPIGREITVHASGSPHNFPNLLNIRMNRNTWASRFTTNCKNGNVIRVGDQYGTILITGFKSKLAKQCHVKYDYNDYATDAQAASADETSGDAGSGSSVGVVVLGIGLAVVAIVVVLGAAVLNRRHRAAGRYNWSDAGSEISHESSASTASAFTIASTRTGNTVTAMDLINSHHFSDDASTVGDGGSTIGDGSSAAAETLVWDDEREHGATNGDAAFEPKRQVASRRTQRKGGDSTSGIAARNDSKDSVASFV